MGSIFRRTFKDKASGKVRRVRHYTFKFKNSLGVWVTEPTDTPVKAVALRLLLERESQVAGLASLSVQPVMPDSGTAAAETDLASLISRYLSFLKPRVRPLTHKRRTEYLTGTLSRLRQLLD